MNRELFYFCSFQFFFLMIVMEYPILPLVEFTAIVFLQALATMSSFVVVVLLECDLQTQRIC